MNITFWVLMVLMLLVAIGLLVYPLLKARQHASLAYKDSNLTINDEKIMELDLDLQEGRIDQNYYKSAREELDRELLIDIPVESKETAAEHYTSVVKRHPALALMISVFVPMLALLLYLDLGMHNASDESFVASQQQPQQQQGKQPSIEVMTRKLQAKIDKEGGTVEEWTMLGRSHKYLGENEQAAKAFAVALEKDSTNAQLMLELAEALALNNNRIFTDDARALVLKAHEMEPDNPNTLWFAGVAEFQSEKYHNAIEYLTKVLPLVDNDVEVMKSVISIIAKSRQALVDAGEKMPALEHMPGVEALMAKAKAAGKDAPAMAASKKVSSQGPATRLQIFVDVSDQVKQRFDANDTVFVYAKAKQGPRMPLAVQRITLAALPTTVILDDSMAMVEGMNLSAFDELVISARVTKTGSAIAQSGDYIGKIDVADKSADTKLKVIIDKAVP
jgi:cytochrome c-type biogenesis protein CcmH